MKYDRDKLVAVASEALANTRFCPNDLDLKDNCNTNSNKCEQCWAEALDKVLKADEPAE